MHPYDGAVLAPSPFLKYCNVPFAEEQRVHITPVTFPDTYLQQRVPASQATTRGAGRSAVAACVVLLCLVGALALGDIVSPHTAYMHRLTAAVYHGGSSKGPHNQVRQPHTVLLQAVPKELRRSDQQQLHLQSTVRLATVDPAAWSAMQHTAGPPRSQQQQQQELQPVVGKRPQRQPVHHWDQQQQQQQQRDHGAHQQQRQRQQDGPLQARETTAARPRRQQLRLMAY